MSFVRRSSRLFKMPPPWLFVSNRKESQTECPGLPGWRLDLAGGVGAGCMSSAALAACRYGSDSPVPPPPSHLNEKDVNTSASNKPVSTTFDFICPPQDLLFQVGCE